MTSPFSLKRFVGFLLSVGGARVAGTLISTATFPFLVRMLGVETFGIWSYVLATVAFADVVSNPGITSYVQQQVAARREAAVSLVSDVLVLRFVAGIVAALTLVVVTLVVEPKPEIRRLILLYGIAAVLLNGFSSEYLLSATERFYASSTQIILSQSVYAIGVFAFVREPDDITWVIAATLSSVIVSHLFGWGVLWQQGVRPRLAFNPSRWRAIVIPSAHYGMSTLMSTIYYRTGHFAVRWFLGEHALGLYAAATRLVEVIRSFINIAHGVLMPRIALYAHQGVSFRHLTTLAISILGLITLPLVVGGIMTAPALVPWALGEKFMGSVGPFQWIAPYLITQPAASFLCGTVLYALGHYRAYLVSTVVGAIAAIILCFTLIPLLGLIGACVAFVSGELGVAIAAYFLSPPEIRGSWKNPLVGVAALAAVVMALVISLLPMPLKHPLVMISIGGSVYVLTCGLIGKGSFAREMRDQT